MKKISLILLISLLSTITKAQSYNCSFLNLILKGVTEHRNEYSVYSTLLKGRLGTSSKLNAEDSAKNRIRLSDQIIDSLVKCCNYKVFFDDRLFHMGNTILLIDTFSFFDNNCLNEEYGITIVNQNIDLSLISNRYDVIKLKSIRVYKSNLIIALQHINSKNEVRFHFQVTANLQPQLTDIVHEYPLYDW